jgi:hypothetical protein
VLPATLELPEPREPDVPTRRAGRDELLDTPAPRPSPVAPAVSAPVDVRAERDPGDPSITISWTAGSGQDVEYKITRLGPDGRGQVVGRTRSTTIVDGAVPRGSGIPTYEVVARLGTAVSEPGRAQPARQPAAVPAAAADPQPEPEAPPPGGIPAVRHLAASAAGPLTFDWPPGVTEAMVVVRGDRPPAAPDDPAATAWKITNMRYELDGGLRLPASVALPCHVAVASCTREGGALVVAPGFDPTAHAAVGS